MSASTARKSLVRAAQDGERRWFFGGGLHIWKATVGETGGAFLLFEDRMDHGKVTPLHIHPDSDETMIVLEGEILMHLDGEQHTIQAGGIASAPRGIPHAFKVTGAGGARLLCLHTPGWPASPSEAMTAGASLPGRWTWAGCRLQLRRTAASRSSARPRSARSRRAELAGARQPLAAKATTTPGCGPAEVLSPTVADRRCSRAGAASTAICTSRNGTPAAAPSRNRRPPTAI